MPSEGAERMGVLQGTLDLIVLRTLESMGRQHAYAIAGRLREVGEAHLVRELDLRLATAT